MVTRVFALLTFFHIGNILSTSATIAPALESPSRELAKHMRRDSLEKALQNRPNQEKLVREGILNEEVGGSD